MIRKSKDSKVSLRKSIYQKYYSFMHIQILCLYIYIKKKLFCCTIKIIYTIDIVYRWYIHLVHLVHVLGLYA